MAIEPLTAGDPVQVAGYRLHGRLGAGGMGVVYLAFTPGRRPVAVKVVRPELGADPQFRRRFRDEVDAAQRVHSFYTAPLLDADPDGDPPWLVTGYVAGPSLSAAVAAHGRMPGRTVLLLAGGVAEALAVIHRAGLVHRDLKPSNVLLARDGPRVIDFGIARALDDSTLTATGARVGTPQYMSPEQARGAQLTAAADIFALGATLAFAATGRPAFGDGDPAAVLYRIQHQDPDLAGCPARVRAIIDRCVAKNPADRPSPAEIMTACQATPAVTTIEYQPGWLPRAITAELPRHDIPAPDATAPGTPGFGTPAGAGPAAEAAGAVPGAALPGPALPAAALPGAVLPGAVLPAAAPGAAVPDAGVPDADAATLPAPRAGMPTAPQTAPTAPAAAEMAAPPVPPSGAKPTRRLLRRSAIAVAAATLIAGAVAGYAFGLNGGHKANDADRKTGIGAAAATHGTTSPSASPSPSKSSGLDSCLIGTWDGVSESWSDAMSSVLTVTMHSTGPTQIFGPHGVNTTIWRASAPDTAHANGVNYRAVYRGTSTDDYMTRNGTIYESDLQSHGSWVLYRDGAVDNTGTFTPSTAPELYTCTVTRLTLYSTPESWAETLRRATPTSADSPGVAAIPRSTSSTPTGS
ncbi:MAG TPA: serine/threonine-protein kinase [Streptosporangiaceae bacterium]|jgi:hypothetical protein